MRKKRIIPIMPAGIHLICLLITVIAFAACNDEHEAYNEKNTGEHEVTLNFSIQNAKRRTVPQSRANGNEIKSLYLFLFNESGAYITAVKALEGSTGNDGWTAYSVRLKSSENKRILHIIGTSATESLDRFTNEETKWEYMGKDEREIIPSYKVQTSTFWNRIVLEEGIGSNTNLGNIELLRNQARIEVKNDAPNFTLEAVGLDGTPKYGTIAPFDKYSKTFPNSIDNITSITEASQAVSDWNAYTDANDFEGTFNSNLNNGVITCDLFERNASSDVQPFYIFLKGRHNEAPCYYKIALADPLEWEQMSVLRNHRYILTITKADVPGYSTLQEAMNNPPFSNPSILIKLEKYSKISDGYSSLEVDQIAWFFSTPNSTFTVNFIYKPDTSDPDAMNATVTTEIQQDENRKALNASSMILTSSTDPQNNWKTGSITVSTANLMPMAPNIYMAKIKLRVGTLVRKVNIILAHKLSSTYLSAGIAQENLSSDPKNEKVTITLNISESALSDIYYPIDFQIYTKYLYVDRSLSTDITLVTGNETNQYYYLYTANQPGDHQLHFRRNMANKEENVMITSENFEDTNLFLSATNDLTTLATGKIVYTPDGSNEYPVLRSMRVSAYPISDASYFRIDKDGIYSLKLGHNNDNITFTAYDEKRGSYKATCPHNILSQGGKIILKTYKEVKEGFTQGEPTGGWFSPEPTITNNLSDDVTITTQRKDRTRIYNAEIKSSLPDGEEIVIRSDIDSDVRTANATIGALRRQEILYFN